MEKKDVIKSTIEAKKLIVLALYGLVGLLGLKLVGCLLLEGSTYVLCCADEMAAAFIVMFVLVVVASVLQRNITSEEMTEAEKEFLLHK